MIGKIERVPLREVWKHEAYDFTQYLQDNLDVISGVIDLNLVSAEREQAAGAFSVDLVAEDDCGDTVVIENQLERSDHDHLGKLITYLAAFGAKAAIWIVSDARPEHVAAVAWLSESSSASFYLLKAEAIRIVSDEAQSPPAPIMTLLVGPSLEAKEIGKKKIELAARHNERLAFWQGLLQLASERTKLHRGVKPVTENWVGVSASPGKSFINLNYVIEQKRARVELYIDRGYTGEDNEMIFDQLYANKEPIETSCGAQLSWERLEGKRACRIAWRLDIGGYRSTQEEWPQIQDKLVNAMIRFERAFAPYLKALIVPPVPSLSPETDEPLTAGSGDLVQ